VVVEARTDFHFRTKPLGFALVKHLQPLRRWLHVLDHAEVDCCDASECFFCVSICTFVPVKQVK
jgi:hypothetical protein